MANKPISEMTDDEITKELLNWFKTETIDNVLYAVTNGKPKPHNIELLVSLKKLGLNDEVINVLLHYVFLSSNHSLPNLYAMQLANHWLKNGLTTAEEAMKFAKDMTGKLKNSISLNFDSIGVIFKNIGLLVAIDTPNEELGKAVKELYKME